MKKLYIIFAIFLATLNGKASILNLRLSNNAPFTIIIDGNPVGLMNNNFRIDPLAGGQHFVKVLQQTTPAVGTYNNQAMIQIFNGFININEGMELFGIIDPRTGFSVTRMIPLPQPQYYDPYNQGGTDCNNGNGNNYNYGNGNRNNGYNNRGNGNNNHGNGNYGYSPYMNNRDFDALKNSVNSTPFDHTKKMIAEQAIRTNRLSVYQLKELLQLFTFESTKLQLAKTGYDFSPDKNRFFIINSVFTFSSSIEELNRYISHR